jgi:uncharacterized protein (TIGR02466 family)
MQIPEYATTLRQVAEENIIRDNEPNDIYPVFMSNSFHEDPRISDFTQLVAQEAWNMLDIQGYNMDMFTTHIKSMWMQEHYKHSAMDQHIHNDAQLVGFYFLETPPNCSRAVFHDPRPGKVMANLPERNIFEATNASDSVNFECVPGDMIISNSWLPHSFSRHGSVMPFRFIHFNISVNYNPEFDKCNCEEPCPSVEII